jgi:serine carboxypeptidase-like clade 2
MFFFGYFLVVVSVLVGIVVSQGDRITNLPGLASQPSFAQYAGYVTVDDNAGRTLFYWFTESQSKPASDPVVLWLTGGPGCSSIMALLSENGPFTPNPDGKTLSVNPYSWNKIANVIWLETPSGVGFSYSNTSSDRNVGDVRTADDTYTFLLRFFQRYPQFAGRDFWVTGESYGGHYVPEAVDRILQGNQQGNPKINVKGFMAGNPWTYMPIDNLGAVNTWWSRALIPKSASDLIIQSCNLSDVGPLLTKNSNYEWKLTANCDDAIYNAQSLFSGVDIYDIYIDVCNGLRDEVILNELVKHGATLHSHLLSKKSKKVQNLDPCIDTHLTAYLNQLDVQTAIHARHAQWSECGGVSYSYADVQKSVIPVYQSFFNNHPELQILVYSGDVDAIVPYWGTKLWVDGFNRTVKAPWRAWYDSEQQVGGFVEVYDTFTFTTVRNAGHMVPWYQPERGYIMYSSFLTKGALP